MTTAGARSDVLLSPKLYLRELDPGHVHFCPNPGNAGDSAIAVGAYDLFRSLGIEWTTVGWDEDVDSTGRTVIYGGGGNLAAAYPQARTFIRRHHRRASAMIVLPHTIQGNVGLLAELGPNTVVFCRERTSFEHVRSAASGARVVMADDLALDLDVDALLESSPSTGRILRRLAVRPIRAIRSRMRGGGNDGESLRVSLVEGARAARCMSAGGSTGHLYALRRDRESHGTAPPPGNVDVSAVFSFGVAPEVKARDATIHLLAFLDRFERITTNRLHVGILGALLGKEVDFHANSYFKNEAVYRLSLEARFPNVRWRGTWSGP